MNSNNHNNSSLPDDAQEITLIITNRLSSDNVAKKDVAEVAMESLLKLVSDTHHNKEKNRKLVVYLGGLLAVVQAMRHHVNCHIIQSRGMNILSSISCCKIDDFNQAKAIVAVGGLTGCLEAMKRHDNKTYVQAHGCYLIGLLFASVDVRKEVVEQGGLEAVVKAMKENQKSSPNVQYCGCQALKLLLGNGLGKQKESTWLSMLGALIWSLLQ